MADFNIGSIVDALKEIINQNGPTYQVYGKLTDSGDIDRKTAAALLHVLVSGVLETTDPGYETELLSELIRRECSLNKRMADRLAVIISVLYSGDHRKEWKDKDQEGLRQFFTGRIHLYMEGLFRLGCRQRNSRLPL